MVYVGMDVHSLSTTICIFDPAGESSRQYRTVTVETEAEAIGRVLRPLSGRCKVAYEIGAQAQWVMAVLMAIGVAEIFVANPSRIPWLFRDGRKNDKLDARKLATLLYLGQLPTVHLPSADVSAWRALIHLRRTVVKRRTMVKNQIRSILRAYVYRCPHKSCWSKVGRTWLTSLTFDAARGFMVEMLLSEMDALTAQLGRLHDRLDEIAVAHPDVALLRTIPGIGPRTAEAIAAFADGVQRFGNRKKFASYFGMTPTLDASGGRERLGHISRRGPSVVRWLIVEAAHIVIRRNPEMRAYFDRLHRDKKDRYKKAIVATGRKLLTIAFAMMRDRTSFAPDRVSAAA